MRWADVLPAHIAMQQEAWEKSRAVKKMRELGYTYSKIGGRIGITASHARHLHTRMEHRGDGASPVEKWMMGSGDIAALAA